MARGWKRAINQPTPSLAPPTPASTGGPLYLLSTSQPTLSQAPPMTVANMGSHLVLPSPTYPLQEPLPTSQLSSRSSPTSLTTLSLRSRRRSKICGGESFRKNGNPFVCVLQQKDLTERFTQSKYLEELHKHQKGEKKEEEYVQRKAEEDAEASDTPMPDDLQLMAIITGGVSHSHLYGAGSEEDHFIVESSRAAAGLASCSLDNE
ncbi:hypothetical protein M9H77_36029 [Catharanthus roseus]|uniref:Uncharacterized protein n=1 Tax=Catharanthus roseus TaxID=4058 RepID=A0ACB9ZSE5_CATRO|nr:hypothetical protein M9H77_36029 [Catharanthus roseus]